MTLRNVFERHPLWANPCSLTGPKTGTVTPARDIAQPPLSLSLTSPVTMLAMDLRHHGDQAAHCVPWADMPRM